jgi:hypothetical protein
VAVLNAELAPPVANVVLVTVLVVLASRLPLPTTESFSKPNTLLLVLLFVDVFVDELKLPLLLVLESVYEDVFVLELPVSLLLESVYVFVEVLPPLLTLVALPPLVADAVPPELPVDDADWLVDFELSLSFVVTLLLFLLLELIVVLLLSLVEVLLLSLVLVLEFVFETDTSLVLLLVLVLPDNSELPSA